jgi:hypothetical protein
MVPVRGGPVMDSLWHYNLIVRHDFQRCRASIACAPGDADRESESSRRRGATIGTQTLFWLLLLCPLTTN